jgi:hypothetical protein
MLAPTATTKRLLETVQLLLTFVSTCAVVEATRIHTLPHDRPGSYAAAPQRDEGRMDRRLGDLARVERKRREAEQQSSLRNLDLGRASQGRRLPDA